MYLITVSRQVTLHFDGAVELFKPGTYEVSDWLYDRLVKADSGAITLNPAKPGPVPVTEPLKPGTRVALTPPLAPPVTSAVPSVTLPSTSNNPTTGPGYDPPYNPSGVHPSEGGHPVGHPMGATTPADDAKARWQADVKATEAEKAATSQHKPGPKPKKKHDDEPDA
jgi:hypothetical protein